MSVVPVLFKLGEKERGGVEAPELRRRRICNLFRSAFLWLLLNMQTAIEKIAIKIANGSNHSFDKRIEKVILNIYHLNIDAIEQEKTSIQHEIKRAKSVLKKERNQKK